jgi:hypothetical protein
MARVKLIKAVSGSMWGYADPQVGDVLDVTAEQAEDMIAGGWAEKVETRRKVRRGQLSGPRPQSKMPQRR